MAKPKTPVLFLNSATRPPLGADIAVVGQIMREIDRGAYEVHAVCAPGSPDAPTPTFQLFSRIPDVRLHLLDLGPELSDQSGRARIAAVMRTWRAAAGLLRLTVTVRRNHIKLIHANDRPRDAAAAVVVARLAGAKAVVHVHVGYGDWMSGIRKWALKRADALIAVSNFVKDTLVESGHDPSRISVVLNGIDPDDWRPDRAHPARARRELGVPEHAPLLLTVCRLFPSKGPGDLIRAMPGITVAHPDARLVIVGKEMTPGYQQELSSISAELGVRDNVIFAGWRDDVPDLMAAADVYAMPSYGEPFGLVYVEAMAMGVPVVALRHGGALELVEDGVTGLLVDPGDISMLTRHLLALLDAPDRRRDMGRAGRRRVETLFTTRRMAADTATVYQALLS
jgi:glycosyltransferase involved in cell wall biosynthesis